MTTTLPTVGPGALKPREDPNQRAGKDIQNMGPATDFYKKLALDCSGQQVSRKLSHSTLPYHLLIACHKYHIQYKTALLVVGQEFG